MHTQVHAYLSELCCGQELEIDFNRLDVEFSQLMAPIVFVSFLPMHQTMTTDDSISVVSLLVHFISMVISVAALLL